MKITKALVQHDQVEQVVGIDIRPPAEKPDRFIFVKRDVREPVTDLLKTHRILKRTIHCILSTQRLRVVIIHRS